MLEFDLEGAKVNHAWEHDGQLFLRIEARLMIKNTGRVAAYKWSLVTKEIGGFPNGRDADFLFGDIPGLSGHANSVRIDDKSCRAAHVEKVELSAFCCGLRHGR